MIFSLMRRIICEIKEYKKFDIFWKLSKISQFPVKIVAVNNFINNLWSIYSWQLIIIKNLAKLFAINLQVSVFPTPGFPVKLTPYL